MQSTETDIDLAVNDLGPLAWVLDELRKSLETAGSALRRFVRDADKARGTDMASMDAGQLRIARQQLHQAVGALEMVGLAAPAHMLRAMEGATQKFVEHPELCTEMAASKVERAGFALTEYLESVLQGKPVSSVGLFPQYREVQVVAGADRVHPADLWDLDWRWLEPEIALEQPALAYDAEVRGRMDHAVLKIVKNIDAQAAHALMNISLGFVAAQTHRQPRIFWKICAAYFEALALGLLPNDLYVKRAASRVLMQYAALAKGDLGVSDRLAQDLLFFCSQVNLSNAPDARNLMAVRRSWNLIGAHVVDYAKEQFGRYDPALLAQARKRINAAKENWSGLSGGDLNKLKSVSDQFGLVCDSLVKLQPTSAPLAKALSKVVQDTVTSGQAPRTELAMEVATAILYLEAAFEDLDPSTERLAMRTGRLAQRLTNVGSGGAAEALEPWMEELYRRVSDRQTMGSVVGELRSTLNELEKLLDQFFRNSADKSPLRDAPAHFSQMRGVLSVLGLDQASQAVMRMREAVEEILVNEVDEEKARAAGTFDKLGNNLGALGFLIDMLSYQPALAKKLFTYDDKTGELKPLMGRVEKAAPESNAAAQSPDGDSLTNELRALASAPQDNLSDGRIASQLDHIATQAVLADKPALAQSAREAVAAINQVTASVRVAEVAAPVAPPEADFEEDELRDIFLEEAREVVQTGLAAIDVLQAEPSNMAELTTLRRAFHTLKGSSRMVGLNEFGEAGWSLEQLINTWLADQKPANDDLCSLSRDAMRGFERWVEDIATGSDGAWKASAFRTAAEALRTANRLEAIVLPGAEVAPAETVAPATTAPPEVADVAAPAVVEFAVPEAVEAAEPEAVEAAVPAADANEDDPFGFGAGDIEIEVAAPVQEPENAASTDFEFDLPELDEPSVAAAPAEAIQVDDIDFESLASLAGTEVVTSLKEENPAAEPSPAPDFAADFAIDLDSEAATPGAAEVLPEPAVAQADEFEFSIPDFSDAPAAELIAPEPEPEPEPEPVVAVEAPIEVPEVATIAAAAESATEPEADALSAEALDEPVKVIGDLRIGIPLYNVYLAEADEWSRRLQTEMGEWAMQPDTPLPESIPSLAHGLAGSSATVGFTALSDLARSLENALLKVLPQNSALPEQVEAFTLAADDIRRLLHLFAAGFLKTPDPAAVQRLQALENLEIPAELLETPEPEAPIESDPSDPFDVPGFSMTAALAGAAITDKPLPSPSSDGVPAALLSAGPTPVFTPKPMPVIASQESRMAPAAQRSDSDDGEDEIDVTDALDPDLFSIFEEEALELMPQLGTSLRQWAQNADNRGARDEVMRVLHTLKGSARLAGALRLGEMAHRMESEIESFGSDAILQTADFEPMLQRFDNMQTRFDILRATGGVAPEVPAEEQPVEAEAEAAVVPVATANARTSLTRPIATALSPLRATNTQVRVRTQLLDRLVNQAGEVIMTRSRLEAELGQLRGSLADLTGNLDRLRTQLRDIELQAESQMQSRLAQAKDSAAGFDPLEFDRFTRVQELTRMMAESVNDVATVQRNLHRTVEATEDDLIAQARQTRELQRDLLRTRMVEFEGISDRLYRVVRQASKDAGKQVKLDITGGSIEMDRGVLDRMTPAFEHLLRNCVAHGLEDADTRAKNGKEAAGNIVIDLHHEGNDVSVSFSDDGAGLNLPRIREKALQQGLITQDQAVTDQEVSHLIFMPGFSTAAQVTELAGRGVGMDVVRSEVTAVGGRIETSTVAGKGTTFKLVLPLTTAVTQVVMLRIGALAIGVPATVVEVVRRVTPQELQTAYEAGTLTVAGVALPFYWAGALLQASAQTSEPAGKSTPVVVFQSAGQRVAMHVDEVLGNQEVVVKNLGPQLARLPGLAAMTVLPSGAVVLIYNPVALSAVYGEKAHQFSNAARQKAMQSEASSGADVPVMVAKPQVPTVPLVMVVDDSITVRRVTQRLLQREGYRVVLAADGLQALERLSDELPAVVLSDIEMPRMDGFDLARNIRADNALKALPIIMITSRIAEKHREHARELGVNHYLGKPYSEDELMGLVRHYCGQEVTA